MRMHTQTNPIRRPLLVVALIALALAGCGGDGAEDAADGADPAAADTASPTDEGTDDDTGSDDMSDDMSEDDGDMDDMSDEDMGDQADDDMDMADDEDVDGEMDMSGDYGEPADPAEADRVIDVNVDNDLAFEPADFEVAAGEVVTFRIGNTGDVEHEFVLGDQEAQDEMAEMMESGDDHAHSGDMGNAVTVHAGETGELTWRFTSPGTVLVGCHVAGHYEAGMTGTVTVTQ